ncbi:MAG: molecular chaperone GrpE [Candidatus Paceibacteria bacterium]|jgi:molecular chaperone GrpE
MLKKKPKEEEFFDDVVFEDEETSKIEKLKKELKNCKEEKQEYLDGWQRAQADSINLKKRLEQEKRDFAKYSTESFILEIIPVLDSFDMAFKDKVAWEKAPENWRVGIEYIYTQLKSTLENNGVRILSPLGETFDPNLHNSIENVEGEEGKVMEVIQKGYELNDKLIRPANVKVGSTK